MNVVTFSELRSNLKEVMNVSADQHDPVVIHRRGGEHMILMSLKDYESATETAYLFSTKANTEHLRKSLASARSGKSKSRKLLDA